MKRMQIAFVATMAAFVILPSWFVIRKGYCGGGLDVREVFSEVHEIRGEISLLNLINGLYLSPEQMTRMLPILRKVEGIRGEYRSRVISQAHGMEWILTSIREVVDRDEEIEGELIREFRRANKEMEGLRDEFHGKLVEYEAEIKAILNENQLALIDGFKPCVIPPHDTQNAARVGQASADTHMGQRLLTRVRHMDEKVYQRRKPLLMERSIERVEGRVGLLSEEERAEEKRRVAAIFTRARELSDVDFEAQKANLARDLKEPYEKALQSRHRRRRGDLDKVGKFLLDPKLIPILERRLAL